MKESYQDFIRILVERPPREWPPALLRADPIPDSTRQQASQMVDEAILRAIRQRKKSREKA